MVIGDHTRRALWKLDSAKFEKLLATAGLDLTSVACYQRIDAMRLIVNVFKHGEVRSLGGLRERFPEFLRVSSHGRNFYDDTNMEMTDDHIEEFAAAIELFWRELPPTVTFDEDAALDVPDEFEKTWNKDLASPKTSRGAS